MTNQSKLGGIFVFASFIIFLLLTAALIQNFLYTPKKTEVLANHGKVQLVVYKSHDTHFRLNGKINRLDVRFLIDTGATITFIPGNIAKKLNLPDYGQIEIQTANGRTTGNQTEIEELVLEGINFGTVKAIVKYDLYSDELLLGMNVLQHFKIIQSAEQMILLMD